MSLTMGSYTLDLLETGEFALDGGAMFGVVPKNLWQKNNPADSENRIEMALRILLIRSRNQNILVDSGIGTNWDEKYKEIYRIDHSRYSLEKALRGVHLKTSDITDVILTHLHFDHVGGCTYKEGDDLKLTFPKATHYIQKKQWEWARHPADKDRASFLEENILPLKNATCEFLEGEKEIYPGIHILVSHGHTPSQQVVKVTDGEKTVFYCGDLIPTSSHIPIPYVMSYDNMPLVIMEEKRNILDQAARENWILCFEHDPKVKAATVMKDPKRGRFSIKETVMF